jgi:hypothetical protein
MKILRRRAIIILFLALPAFVFSAESFPTDTIPAYEPVDGNYRFCQTFKTALDWGANCFVATGLIGTYSYRRDLWRYQTTFWTLEPVSYACVGMWLVGGAFGAFVGYGDGEYCTQERRANPGFHLAKNNAGHRIMMIFHDYPRYYAVWQPQRKPPAMPDIIRLGFAYRTWSNRPQYDFLRDPSRTYPTGFFGREFKWDANAVWDIFRYRQAAFYGGLGGGWARARDYTTADGSSTGVESGFIHVLGGVRVNVLDYFFVETEADYEPWGVFQKLRELHPYHPSGKTTVHIYLGMYVFRV